jgi:hypothetical protein
VEKFEREISSSEIFAAFFELELTGKTLQMAGKKFVKSVQVVRPVFCS